MKEIPSLSMFFLFTILIFSDLSIHAQVAINTDGSAANSSAILDLKSTDKGLLLPRMSLTQMNAITSPPEGLIVFCTTVNSAFCYNGSSWMKLFWNDGESCGTIDYGGQIYQTVIIGTQCWMAENLNIGSLIVGTQDQTDNDTIEKYCYNNSTTNCDTYGGLYQWDEIMQYVTTEGTQGICPPGWHLPSDAEWCILENEVDSGDVPCDTQGFRGTDAGKHLKTTTEWYVNTGTDSFDFSALPTGFLYSNNNYIQVDTTAIWWSSTDFIPTHKFYHLIRYNSDKVVYSFDSKECGISVRCVRE